MILLVDVGNTRAKYCIIENGIQHETKAIETEKFTEKYLADNFTSVTELVVSSVSHSQITTDIEFWCKRNNIIFKQVVTESKRNKVINAYEESEQLGVDRWLALVATAALYPNENCLIIDCGTATTIDLLSANGQHQGGWILAGTTMLVTSLLANTSNVIVNKKEQPSLAFGHNTSENVHNAAWVATVATIHMAQLKSTDLYGQLDKIIITGGNGKALSALLSKEQYIQKNIVIEDLVLQGLKQYL